MNEARAECKINAVCGPHRRDTKLVALDGDGRAKRWRNDGSVKSRQRRAQNAVDEGNGKQDEERAAKRGEFDGPPINDGHP